MRIHFPMFVVAVVSLSWCAVSSAQDIQSAPLWQGHSAQPAALVGIAENEFSFTFPKLAEKEVPLSAAEFQRYGAWKDVARGAQVLLVDGSVLVGDVLRITQEQLVLGDATGLGRCRFEGAKIPLGTVRGVLYQPAAERQLRDDQFQELTRYNATVDTIELVGGERLGGLLLGSRELNPEDNDDTPQPLRFQVTGQTTPIDVHSSRIRCLAFNAALTQPKSEVPDYWMGLNDGNWLAVKSLQTGEKEVALELACGVQLRTPLVTDDEFTPQFFQAVTYLESLSAPVTYLSDLKPTRFESIPLLTIQRALQNDLNALGGRMRTASSIARKGIGIHGQASVEYEVPANTEWFLAELAVDAVANQRGSIQGIVSIRPSTDDPWNEIAKTSVIRSGDLPELIQVPLTQCSHIRLETRTADDGDSGDVANWMYARFLPAAN